MVAVLLANIICIKHIYIEFHIISMLDAGHAEDESPSPVSDFRDKLIDSQQKELSALGLPSPPFRSCLA